MESWRKVWRDGIAPSLSEAALEALLKALRDDDARLIQGVTTSPPPSLLWPSQDGPVEAACALGYCGWQGARLETVAEVEEFFSRVCLDCDERLGDPAACPWFITWFDAAPREEMRQALLPEVELALTARRGVHSNV